MAARKKCWRRVRRKIRKRTSFTSRVAIFGTNGRRKNLEKAINYFQQAIDLDPDYALAYAGLGDAHSIVPIYAGTPPQDDIPKALVAAGKAVELDDSLAEAHTSLANALGHECATGDRPSRSFVVPLN